MGRRLPANDADLCQEVRTHVLGRPPAAWSACARWWTGPPGVVVRDHLVRGS